MHAKTSRLGLRFFAHDHANGDCRLNGESPQHRYLKSTLAQIIRSQGWTATIEAAPTSRDKGGWRADVLANPPGGRRRIAFEVQLASMTASVGLERTDVYEQDAVEAIWLCDLKLPSWLGHVPAIVLNHKRNQLLAIPGENLTVCYGILTRKDDDLAWLSEDYERNTAPLLSDVVTGILDKRYKPRQLYGATVPASAARSTCGQRAFIDKLCRENITAAPCPLHGSPAPARTLRRAAGRPGYRHGDGTRPASGRTCKRMRTR
jgi:Competence protein CoiA-like family